MASITWSDVTNFVSSLSSVDVNAQTDILAYVNECHDVTLFGGEESFTLRLLRIYLAAHLGSATATSASGSTTGLIASESVGGISRSYIYPDLSTTTALQTTTYGREYASMVRTSPARVGFAIG